MKLSLSPVYILSLIIFTFQTCFGAVWCCENKLQLPTKQQRNARQQQNSCFPRRRFILGAACRIIILFGLIVVAAATLLSHFPPLLSASSFSRSARVCVCASLFVAPRVPKKINTHLFQEIHQMLFSVRFFPFRAHKI